MFVYSRDALHASNEGQHVSEMLFVAAVVRTGLLHEHPCPYSPDAACTRTNSSLRVKNWGFCLLKPSVFASNCQIAVICEGPNFAHTDI